MAFPPDTEFKEISSPFFMRLLGELPFDVFIRRATSAYSLLFKKGDRIDPERVKS